MNAVSEGDMVNILAGNVELVWILVRCRVAVRTGNNRHYQLIFLDFFAEENGVLLGKAWHQLDRWFIAQHFFNSVGG